MALRFDSPVRTLEDDLRAELDRRGYVVAPSGRPGRFPASIRLERAAEHPLNCRAARGGDPWGGRSAGLVRGTTCATSVACGHDRDVAATYSYEVRCSGEIVSTGMLLLDSRPQPGETIELGALSGTVQEVIELTDETRLIVDSSEPR